MLNIQATVTLVLSLPFVTGTVCLNEVVDFNLIDTSASPPIFTELTPVVDLLDFPSGKLSIEAKIASSPSNCDEKTAKCIMFFLDDVPIRREKLAPYTYFGDIPGRFIRSGKPPIGVHTVRACTYSDKACKKDQMGCREMKVDFLDDVRPVTVRPSAAPVTDRPSAALVTDRPSAAPVTDHPSAAPVTAPVAAEPDCSSVNEVVGFELVDAESPYRPVISPFTPPMIDLLEFPTCALNIFATVKENTCGDAPIRCVKLSLGQQQRKEVFAPYALYSNTGQFIKSGKPQLGAQSLKACTYTDESCTEGESGCLDVSVFVKDCISMSM